MHLPKNFRKMSIEMRRRYILEHLHIGEEEKAALLGPDEICELSDALVEYAIGTFPLPVGLASGFLVDGKDYVIPLATEEPSVIAAASYGASLIKAGGGFTTSAENSIVTAQVFLQGAASQAKDRILSAEPTIRQAVDALMQRMVQRGGGFRGLEVEAAEESSCLCVSLDLDVCDAMGANAANTVAEGMKELLSSLSGGNVLMAVLTNAAEKRLARASFRLPFKHLKKGSLSGEEIAKRVVDAYRLANSYPKRALTHNKGIMNGVSALAAATANDGRAIEAAVHFHACRNGSYRPLSTFEEDGQHLVGFFEAPLPFGTVGGAVTIWPSAQLSLKILDNPDSKTLARLAAALGLAQNFAALLALVTEGIQSGHMKLHAAKAAYLAGARGKEIRCLGAQLWKNQAKDSKEGGE